GFQPAADAPLVVCDQDGDLLVHALPPFVSIYILFTSFPYRWGPGPRSQRHDTITKFLLQTGPCAKHTNPIWDGCAKRGFLTVFIGKCYTSDEKGPVKNL